MFGRITRFIVGVIFLPIVAGVSIAFFRQLSRIDSASLPGSQFFLWGVVAYSGMHLLLVKPQYLYTLGHEVTHALTTWLCGGRVTSFRVSKEGGAVKTTKNNFFISLSPYFIPFYTVIISFIYFLVSLTYELSYLANYFIFLIGFTLAFHIISTVEVMRLEQPDILKTGYLFSITLIYIANVALTALIISLLFREAPAGVFFHSSYAVSKDLYLKIFNQLFRL